MLMMYKFCTTQHIMLVYTDTATDNKCIIRLQCDTDTNNCLLSTDVRHPELLQWVQYFSDETFLFLKVIHVIAATPTATHSLMIGYITRKKTYNLHTLTHFTPNHLCRK